MNTPVKLPSGKILNLARFIALLPVTTTTNNEYDLILEGYSAPINLESRDADALKQLLKLNADISGWDSNEQLRQNQPAIALLAKRIERSQNISQAESLQRKQLFEDFKQIIDAERLSGQQLYSQS
ncbi:MAG: hypothetical protein KME54_02905 [Tolypothrix brevis GSE-NOS-MK-07-07A]|jgi:hypothetical protein|nr:hypothetical protein [Tolypothrix brevis GSE-NOS-MK-07-07A]